MEIPEVSVSGLKLVLEQGLINLAIIKRLEASLDADGRIPGDPLGHLEIAAYRDKLFPVVNTLDFVLPLPGGKSWEEEIASELPEARGKK